MTRNRVTAFTKIGIIPLILILSTASCRTGDKSAAQDRVFRFDRILFNVPPDQVVDSIRVHHPDFITFFRAFNEGIIRIGPDTLADYPDQLALFIADTLISQTYKDIVKADPLFEDQFIMVNRALQKLKEMTGRPVPKLLTYLSGFNQSFTALPGILGMGLDNYLGSGHKVYGNLGIPVYQMNQMNPVNLAPDAVRAWIMSEIPAPEPGSSFLDHLVYQGKILYLVKKLMPKVQDGLIFHFTPDQLAWCRGHEAAIWKYLAEQRVIFSTDRFTIRKFMDEAPFTKDFGNESPGRTGTWIGYRIVSKYLEKNRQGVGFFFTLTNSREILAASDYHP